ncbi:DUF4148 domain-containing protein [Bordetella genomosp. 1]|uniref:DUF4148 domain-containing protein n=1 Tax=Bordetella genomosp. 1 TaxID=1395607 RepID=A0ABX4F252_9BORD|nr:DUF4148 domain-containing protein [Bordetella genomosp. 1]OZI66065.1 hypothetical protein CAL27_08875 [Bordetella genomosp. 1]
MKTLAAAIAVTAAFAGTAQAGEQDWPPADTSVSTVTRAQVVADLQAAREQGLVTTAELAYPPVTATSATQLTREQVQQQLHAAQAAGLDQSGELDYPPVAG